MNITCPHCGFSKSIDPERLPEGRVRVTCPRCSEKFSLPVQAEEVVDAPEVRCPSCGLAQPEAEVCRECGIEMADWQPSSEPKGPKDFAELAPLAVKALPKAGFWIRVAGAVLDSILVMLLQFGLSLLLGFFAGMLSGNNLESGGQVATAISLFTLVLSGAYYVFFTGYCGQTPGKMALRIKVIRTDGREIGYGRAFFREVVAKFISGIIFGIGYLMVAFDEQKQGLHDRMAGTYVIKL